MTNNLSVLTVALQMANKHETAPTAVKPPGEFRETIKIGSASSWDKVTLDLFHVNFNNVRHPITK